MVAIGMEQHIFIFFQLFLDLVHDFKIEQDIPFILLNKVENGAKKSKGGVGWVG